MVPADPVERDFFVTLPRTRTLTLPLGFPYVIAASDGCQKDPMGSKFKLSFTGFFTPV
jgi:hypothetical protein